MDGKREMNKDKFEFAILNIDKPSGPTSFDISDFVREKLKGLGVRKTSHFGTLDPKVTGVLPVALNRACKLSGWFIKKNKTYVGIMRIHEEIDDERLKKEVEKFVGKIKQLPPVKSRVKREEREREVYSFEILERDEKDRKNVLFETKVEAGTYIRKLVHDLGKNIGGAHMLELRRIRAGIFKENSIVNLYDFEKAVELSKIYGIPLHPKYIFYWTQISREEFNGLINWLSHSWINEKIILPYSKTEQEKFALGKRAMELIGIEHDVSIENVVLSEENSKALLANLGIDYNFVDRNEKIFLKEYILQKKFNEFDNAVPVLEILNKSSKFFIKDKAGEFIGTRMGRPEKSKLRKLIGSPNALFPIGREGGRLRSVQVACEVGRVRSSFPLYFCEGCQKEIIYPKCEVCGSKAKKKYFYFKDDEKSFEKSRGESSGASYAVQNLDIKNYFNYAVRKLGLKENEIPPLIKGIRGTSSKNHAVENLAKGILRTKYGLQVNKDGTIRLDATELPLVYFKPKEISVSIEKLLEIGYDEDINGKPLENPNQILELMPHDVILPCCSSSLDEKADDVFFKVAKFIDDELKKFYGLKSFYDIKSKEDLIGQLGVCMAPHNCAGVICRFIGFSKTQGLFASPYMHAAIRRDCDGDEAAIMLLSDVLLNFSRKFPYRKKTRQSEIILSPWPGHNL